MNCGFKYIRVLRSLKTEQCKVMHQKKPDVRCAACSTSNKQDLIDNEPINGFNNITLLESLILAQDERWRRA